jgi:hypothetical protein
MNRNRKFQAVPMLFVERGLQWGDDMVAWYASDEGRRSASRSVSGGWGVETDPIRQAQGKIGEVAAAICCGLDPEITVNWKTQTGGDGGVDIVLQGGTSADVKTTLAPFNLIWSRAINHLYWDSSKRFEVLISVSIDEIKFCDCWIEGWISKQRFFDDKQISDGKNAGRLDVGTWFMRKNTLLNIDDLVAIDKLRLPDPKPASQHFEHYCHCGKWGAWGFGVNVRDGKDGQWFCFEHKPKQVENAK